MNFLNLVNTTMQSLKKNKFRSFLTLLGIIMGVASVTSIYNLGLSMKDRINDELSNLGTNLIVISSYSRHRGSIQKNQPITYEDLNSITNRINEIVTVVPFMRDYKPVSYKGTDDEGTVVGTTSDFFLMGSKVLTEGAYFNSADMDNARKVCVIGNSLSQRLFANEDPINKTIYFNKVPLKVIGVLDYVLSYSAVEPSDINESIYVPVKTFSLYLNTSENKNKNELSSCVIILNDTADAQNIRDKINNILRLKYKIKTKDSDPFNIQILSEFVKMRTKYIGQQIIFLNVTAIIALLVGGINIMNIMLVSVKQRTKEIGLRMALGATPGDVIIQFLTETVIISVIGGIIGMVLSIPVTYYMAGFMLQMSVKFSVGMLLIAFIYSIAVGVVFGLYPARKASSQDPIVALRYE